MYHQMLKHVFLYKLCNVNKCTQLVSHETVCLNYTVEQLIAVREQLAAI